MLELINKNIKTVIITQYVQTFSIDMEDIKKDKNCISINAN